MTHVQFYTACDLNLSGGFNQIESKRMMLFFSRPWNAKIALREHEHF